MVAMFGIFPWILGCDYHPNWRTHIFQRGGKKIKKPPTSHEIIMWSLSFLWFHVKIFGLSGVSSTHRFEGRFIIPWSSSWKLPTSGFPIPWWTNHWEKHVKEPSSANVKTSTKLISKWRFPKMGVPSKSSILDWAFPLETIHFWVPPF